MKERRSLIEGLKPDPEMQKLEEAFVFGAKRKPELVEQPTQPQAAQPIEQNVVTEAAAPQAEPRPEQKYLPQMTGRIPVTTRCRPEVASALKRASLQRQLAGTEPYYVQDIMEEALETWLRERGYAG